MSKVTRLIVMCPNGKRQTVNLTPNSCILQILEEVCQKQNINPDDFDICHYNKPLDLSLPVRFCNLSNNAQLELQPVKTTRKDSLVTVALQLESGERVMKDFVPSTSVWDVVEQCLNNKPDNANLYQKGEPVCIYMRQKLTQDAMKKTTLRGLGLTKGSAIIRLMYRNPEDLSDQAHISAPLTKPPKDVSPTLPSNKLSNNTSSMECDLPADKPEINASKSTTVHSPEKPALEQASSSDEVNRHEIYSKTQEKVTDYLMKDTFERETDIINDAPKIINKENKKPTQMLTEQKMEIEENEVQEPPGEEEEIGAIHYIGGRHCVVYSLNDISEIKKADLPDEFFELTIDDVRYLMEEFKKATKEIENQPLLTKEYRNRHLLQKLGRFKQTVIRVYFPERLVLQAVFEAQETVQDVINFIRSYLEDKNLNFYLYTAPPKVKKDPTKTLIESMLIPAAVVYFGCDKQHEHYLLNTLKVSDPRAASLAAYESRKQAISEDEEISSEYNEMPATSLAETVVDYRLPGPSSSQTSGCIRTSEKVPKWLKMSKK